MPNEIVSINENLALYYVSFPSHVFACLLVSWGDVLEQIIDVFFLSMKQLNAEFFVKRL